MSAGSVESQYLVGSASPSVPLRPRSVQPLLRCQFRDQPIMPDPNANARKARGQPIIAEPSPPPDRAPGTCSGQTRRHLFGRDQVGFVATPGIVQRFSSPPRSRCPMATPTGYSTECRPRKSVPTPSCRCATASHCPIGGIHQPDAAWEGRRSHAHLICTVECDLRLGLEADVQRHPGLSFDAYHPRPAGPSTDTADRRTGRLAEVVRNRQRYRHLTIGLLAIAARNTELVHADRMLAALENDVSSMIHASIRPCFSIAGSTISRTLASTFSSDQVATPTKWSSDCGCCAAVRAGSRLRCHRFHTLCDRPAASASGADSHATDHSGPACPMTLDQVPEHTS